MMPQSYQVVGLLDFLQAFGPMVGTGVGAGVAGWITLRKIFTGQTRLERQLASHAAQAASGLEKLDTKFDSVIDKIHDRITAVDRRVSYIEGSSRPWRRRVGDPGEEEA